MQKLSKVATTGAVVDAASSADAAAKSAYALAVEEAVADRIDADTAGICMNQD